MAKAPQPVYVTPILTAAHAYLDKPDDQAPEGASFKADGKFKVTGVAESAAEFTPLYVAIKAAATAKWGSVDFDEFKWPWTEHDEDARREAFRGKVTITPKSQFQPKLYDSKKSLLPADVKIFGGDRIKAAITLYLYEKVEKVKEGKKVVDVTVRGCAPQLAAVQLIEKRGSGTGGDYGSVFGVEDGYVADTMPSGAAPTTDGDSDGDF